MKTPSEGFPEHSGHCLNCGQAIHGNFCSRCGQNAHTHRLSIWHFIVHDLVHSFWHVDHGIFFTIEEVLIRPGAAALDYIRGKRVGRFPILTLILILLGICFWLHGQMASPHHVPTQDLSGVRPEEVELAKRAIMKVESVSAFLTHYRKWIFLSLLPVGSLSSIIVFRKPKMNFTEHLVINSHAFAGALVVVVYILLFQLCLPAHKSFLEDLGFWLVTALYLYAFAQAFPDHSKRGLLWRFLKFVLLALFFIVLIAAIASSIWTVQLFNEGVLPGIRSN